MMKRSFQQSFSIVGETSGKSSIFSRLALAMVVSGWTSTTLAGLVHEYTFNGTTADSFGGAAMVLPNPSGLGAGGYTFGEGEGPSLTGVMVGGLASHYSMEMSFSVDEVDDGYVKLIDFSNLQDDEGLYLYDMIICISTMKPAKTSLI